MSAARTLLARIESSAMADPSSMRENTLALPAGPHSALNAAIGSRREARLAG